MLCGYAGFKALAADAKAKEQFDAFSPSAQREYVEWIGEGKKRNWKYER